jgi:hypothetical protein
MLNCLDGQFIKVLYLSVQCEIILKIENDFLRLTFQSKFKAVYIFKN